MLDVKQEDVDIVIDQEDEINKKVKWKYNNRLFTNHSFVRQLLMDYISDRGIKSFEEIPSELARFKVYSQDFIVKDLSRQKDIRSRRPIEINGMRLYMNSVYRTDDTNALIEEFKRHFDFDYEIIEK